MYYNHKSHPKHSGRKCPFCDPNFKPPDPWHEAQCVLNKPLFMVIPPGGVHLDCPVHPAGHHVFGPALTWMRSEPSPESNPPGKPWCEYSPKRWEGTCTATGLTDNDTFKSRM